MRSILMFFAFMTSDVFRVLREIMTRLFEPSFAPELELVGDVRAQVFKVSSIFAKRPCSATGGSA